MLDARRAGALNVERFQHHRDGFPYLGMKSHQCLGRVIGGKSLRRSGIGEEILGE